ncbi:transcription factor S, partial [Methanobrevibacter sp. OttesenSCG-928-I08]|nr:transcription factor S [Methanobrevibacter sp. OttesenSCG-928-I08]
MEFCPNCKKILIPKNNKLKCSCGYEKELSKKDIENQYNFKGETIPENEIILKKDNNVTLPTKK